MERTYIGQLNKKIGKKVNLFAWIYNIRDHGSIKFLILRDKTGTVQAIIKKKEILEQIESLGLEFVVEIIGIVKKEKQAPGGIEIIIEEIKILSSFSSGIPISVIEKEKEPSLEKRMDWRWLDIRKPKKRLIFEVWTTMEMAFREFWIKNGYTQIHSPKFISSASESGSELFEVKYFDKKAYLAQSPQFYKQMAMASGLEKVFEIGPVFRANPSFTSRHDTEYTSYDMEISFIKSHQELIKEEEKLLAFVVSEVKKKHGKEIEKHYGRKLVVPKTPFPQVTIEQAKKMLLKHSISVTREHDLSPEEERKLCEIIKKKYGHEFVFVTEYPSSARPFYHMRPKDKGLTKGFDLLWNGLEVTTGAQREHRYKILKKQAIEKGVKPKEIEYYLNFFKFGCPPHGGLALGATRLLMKIFGIGNVREVTFLYRGVKRLTP